MIKLFVEPGCSRLVISNPEVTNSTLKGTLSSVKAGVWLQAHWSLDFRLRPGFALGRDGGYTQKSVDMVKRANFFFRSPHLIRDLTQKKNLINRKFH